MTEKTYYDILGVDKDADLATIKKSYRKLIRKYHPDVSQEADAAERTAEINAAYEVLSDEDKRSEYDAMLANPFNGGNHNHHSGFADGFYQHFNNGQFHSGAFDQGDFHFEDLFSAFARQQSSRPTGPIKGEDQHARLDIDIQTSYTGAERSLTVNVPTRDDHGRMIYTTKTFNVKIPKGISEGQQIRLAKQGLPGLNGGDNGDLYLQISFKDTSDLYVKDKKDVYQTVDIMPWQAVLGGEIVVETIAGKLKISLPAGSQTGRTMRLRSKGLPAKEAGDLYLTCRINIPKNLTEEDRRHWQSLASYYAASN